MIIEALLAVRPDWIDRADLGTIITYSKVRSKTFLSKEDAEASKDEDYDKQDWERNRTQEERDKDEYYGLDTVWGRGDREFFGIATIDIPDSFENTFIENKHKLDLRMFPDALVATWQDKDIILKEDRRDFTPVTVSLRDLKDNSKYIDS